MNITVIGTGYVGLVSGVCYAEMGNEVVCVDKDIRKIELLNNGGVPIYEPGLGDLINKNIERNRLSFSTDIKTGLNKTDIVIIAVGTPSLANGEADLSYLESAVKEVAESINKYTIIVIKSTVPVGTNDKVKKIVGTTTSVKFDVVSVPEFLREGSAVQDTLNPDRIVIGGENEEAIQIISELHIPFNAPIIRTDLRSAEMIKYASNAFLATKISFINEIANICEKVGANVLEVSKGMGLDNRIGNKFLQAGIGYGGSCFPKDTRALIQIAGNAEYDFKLLKAVVEVNQLQRETVVTKLVDYLGTLEGKTIGIWGLAFKPGTDDVRESPAIEIIKKIIDAGAHIRVYDPVSMINFSKIYDHPNIFWCENEVEAADEADAICLLTEWDVFKRADFKRIAHCMRSRLFIDGRNAIEHKSISDAGLQYYGVGTAQLEYERLNTENTHGQTVC